MIDPSANSNANEAYEGWDSPIGEEADEGGYVIVPDGVYAATVVKLDREWYEPGPKSKLPPCWQATVHLRVVHGDDEAVIRENIYCTKKQAWKIKQLFVSTGQIPADVAPGWVPPWSELVGRDCAIRVSTSEYNGKTYNDVDRFLAPEEAAKELFGGQGAPAAGNAPQQPSQAAQTGFNFPGKVA